MIDRVISSSSVLSIKDIRSSATFLLDKISVIEVLKYSNGPAIVLIKVVIAMRLGRVIIFAATKKPPIIHVPE